jgi:hypothetical protein
MQSLSYPVSLNQFGPVKVYWAGPGYYLSTRGTMGLEWRRCRPLWAPEGAAWLSLPIDALCVICGPLPAS